MWYDVLVLAILGYTTIRGAMKGAVWQLAAIAGLVVCLVFAESISAAAGPYVKLDPPMNHWVVMIGAYLIFTFVAFALARMLNDWIEKVKFGEFNQHLGALLGFAKGVLMCLVLTFFIVTVSEDAREMLRHSHSGHAAAIIMDRLHPVMPEKLRDALEQYIHQLDSPDLPLRYADHDHAHHEGGQGDASEFVMPPELDEFLSRVPEDVRGDVREILTRSLRNAAPEDRSNLQQELEGALNRVTTLDDLTALMDTLKREPADLIGVLSGWLQGSGGGGETPAERRQRLLTEISSAYSDFDGAQRLIRQDIEAQLAAAAVPPEVAVKVLEDWRADLWGEADPVPSTGVDTLLVNRIARHLQLAAQPGGAVQ